MLKCASVGSINMDMVVTVDRFPRPGESRLGETFKTVPGGKGANQAIAMARLGVPVMMGGRVGRDDFGRAYLKHFAENGVDASAVSMTDETGTGVALIEVNASGENHIICVPAANGSCDAQWMDETLEKLKDCDIVLLQLEITLPTVYALIRAFKAAGKTVMLDPAPAVPVPDEILAGLDYITPNETELRVITPDCPESAGIEARMEYLLSKGVKNVVHKCGGNGAYIANENGIEHISGYKVNVVDTTAAGDTFNAGLAAGLAMGRALPEAVRLGNAAAALSVTAAGAQDGMPNLTRALALMEEQKGQLEE